MTHPACEDCVLQSARDLHNNYYSMTFGPFSRASACKPGTFLHIRMPGTEIYFRRAMSVAAYDAEARKVEIIFKIFGRGTSILSRYEKGDHVDILGPLGKPFSVPKKNERIVMVAGGVGFPPLLFLANDLVKRGFDPQKIEFFYGGRTAGDIVEKQRIKKLGINFHPATDDGSFGTKGLVTQPVEKLLQEHKGEKIRLYGCGPELMLKATNELGLKYEVPGELSLEAPMPCGIGVCLGCVVPLTAGGYARVCKDGPVFKIGEVVL